MPLFKGKKKNVIRSKAINFMSIKDKLALHSTELSKIINRDILPQTIQYFFIYIYKRTQILQSVTERYKHRICSAFTLVCVCVCVQSHVLSQGCAKE